jgi:hypothetical protein
MARGYARRRCWQRDQLKRVWHVTLGKRGRDGNASCSATPWPCICSQRADNVETDVPMCQGSRTRCDAKHSFHHGLRALLDLVAKLMLDH